MLQQMSQHAAVLKAWKGVVTDALADHRFFQASPSTEPSWRPLVHALTLADRERMPELVGKAGCSGSASGRLSPNASCTLSQGLDIVLGQHLHQSRARSALARPGLAPPHLHPLLFPQGHVSCAVARRPRETRRLAPISSWRSGPRRGAFSASASGDFTKAY